MAKSLILIGTWDENRTRTDLRPRDFKSLASTCSATQANLIFFVGFCNVFTSGCQAQENCISVFRPGSQK